MEETDHKQALPDGHRLGGYRIEHVIGVGGFGVTYLAEHAALGRKVAIKEYLPNEFAVRDGTEVHPKSQADRDDFQWGLERFLDEARTMARFEHRNIVRVRDFFEANRTAYLVMDYEDGEPLDRILERRGRLTEPQLLRVLLPVVDGLREIHAAGFLHRDIKPSNVYVRRSDESPVLLDFGAARQALGRKSKSLTAVVSAGYSPPEQYEGDGEQGPWSDIYALSALCYRAIAGTAPVDAPRRQGMLLRQRPDPLPRLADNPPEGYSTALLEAVDSGLSVIETERPQSLEEWSVRFRDSPAEPMPAHGPELVAEAESADRPRRHGRTADAMRNRAFEEADPVRRHRRRGLVAACAAGAATALVAAWYLYSAWETYAPVDTGDQAAVTSIAVPASDASGHDASDGERPAEEQPSAIAATPAEANATADADAPAEQTSTQPEAPPAAAVTPQDVVLAAGRAFLAENGKREEVVTTASGLQYEVLASGVGDTPGPHDAVTIHYHGTRVDGRVFDSSADRGAPMRHTVDGFIKGWTEALQLMQVGDKWKLFIPPELAYGERAMSEHIRPNETLIFEVELLGVERS